MPPGGLHDFFAAYVRYATHLGAYLGLAANPYPGFTGEPGYPVDVEIPGRSRSRAGRSPCGSCSRSRRCCSRPCSARASAAAAAARADGDTADGDVLPLGVGGVAAVCAFLGWFASLALGRMPNGLRDLAAYGVGYTAQAYAYVLLLTDRYPNSDPDELGPAWSLPPHPVRPRARRRRPPLAPDGRSSGCCSRSRTSSGWRSGASRRSWRRSRTGSSRSSRGRSAEPLHRFLAAYVRYTVHVTAFVFLVANPFPGFVGAPGYPVDIAIAPAERQSRWITFFRTFLALPAFLIAGALGGALVVVGILGWFAALVTGRMPTGLRNLGAMSIRYQAQTHVYWFVLTDRYPYASPALRPPPSRAGEATRAGPTRQPI